MDSLETFIKKAKKTHGDRYDYSKVVYKGSQTDVIIICPKHGEFIQKPANHIRGNGCPYCAKEERGLERRKDTETFIKQAIGVHGNKYDYSKTKYKNARTKVTVICPEHGSFTILPNAHLNGEGCPKCSGRGLNNYDIIAKFKEVHGDKYDYSKTEFTKMHEKVIVICPKHGEFLITPSKHILGQGCKICGTEKRRIGQIKSFEKFVEDARKTHGDKYDYSESNYVSSTEKIKIICPKHGSFYQFPYDHISGHGCPKCANIISKSENEIAEFIENLFGKENVIRRARNILPGNKEIDIYIPSKKIGIEYNGLFWHSDSSGKNKWYHTNKTNECEKLGIRLIQIFEDEYEQNKQLVLDKIEHILGSNHHAGKIMGRKCTIIEISSSDSKDFLKKNHIQGNGEGSIKIGAYFNNNLIGVMLFKDWKNGEWELTRFATDINYISQGVGSKMFNYFIKHYSPKQIKSFADRRWSTIEKNIYTTLGFELVKILKPEYRYISTKSPSKRLHKFGFRKQILHKKYGLPLSMSESEMATSLGYSKVWDCGLLKYVWTKKEDSG